MTTFLHIGTHKTGTTSIQRFARSKEQDLRQRGLHYPNYRLIDRPGHYGHHHFAHAVAGKFSERFKTDEDIVRFVDAIRKVRAKQDNVLISAEPIYRHVYGEGDIWEKKANYARRLKDFLTPLLPVRVVLVLRRQDTFALSLYQEEIKAKKQARSFSDFAEDKRAQFDYVHHYRIYEEIFGRVDVLCYERLSQGSGLVQKFFGHIGTRLPKTETRTELRNQSLHPAILQYKKELNASKMGFRKLQRISEVLPDISDELYPGDRYSLVAEEELNQLYAEYAEHNRELARLTSGFWVRTFFPDRGALPPVYPTASADELALIDERVRQALSQKD